jgi:hypothetical protein
MTAIQNTVSVRLQEMNSQNRAELLSRIDNPLIETVQVISALHSRPIARQERGNLSKNIVVLLDHISFEFPL